MDYIGKRLDGRYLVEQLIGEGGMADVYRGEDLLEHRPVAIKILREEHNANDELVRRFTNESRAISVLSHPNIVRVYDVSVDERLHYIVMELITGITLKEYIEQRGEPLTYKEVVHFTSQVLHALNHAHDKGIVHRDIKPQNIMILEDGSIKVMDFGIARLARSEVHTDGEQAIGSVHYISPEQAQGAETDLRSDIYSVGIMMYEMLSGTLPFEDTSAVAIAVKQISDEAVPLGVVNPSVPQGLADISARAMSKDPRRRYQSSLEMLRDIEEFKRNPSIKFEYDYLTDDSPARYVGSVMGNQASGGRPPKNRAGKKAGRKDGRERRRRRKKIGVLVPIFLGFTIAVVGISALYAYDMLQNSENPLFGEFEEIQLPDFTGQKYADVVELCKKAPYNHLRIKPDEESNLTVAPGTVISQNPTSDKKKPKTVKANQVVYLVVSKDYEAVEVPDVTGLSRHDAIAKVLGAGLTPYARLVRDDTHPIGTAIGTQPEAYTPIKSNQTVTILIATNVDNYNRLVPDVKGLASVEDARRVLEKVGLLVGQVKTVESDQPEGSIVRQSPDTGDSVMIGTGITLYIAKAPPPPPPEPASSSKSKDKDKDKSKSKSSSSEPVPSESESESDDP